MRFEESGIEGKIVQFATLESIMKTLEMIRGGQWDWERVTYDHKFVNRDTGAIHYLRVQGIAIKGEIEFSDAEVQLMTPILGRYYYPHGIEYDEDMPEVIIRKCKEKLSQLQAFIDEVALVKVEAPGKEEVTQRLLGLPEVNNVSELHLWEDESGSPILSCHLIVEDGRSDAVIKEASELVNKEFGIHHTTIQIDHTRQQPIGTENGEK